MKIVQGFAASGRASPTRGAVSRGEGAGPLRCALRPEKEAKCLILAPVRRAKRRFGQQYSWQGGLEEMKTSAHSWRRERKMRRSVQRGNEKRQLGTWARTRTNKHGCDTSGRLMKGEATGREENPWCFTNTGSTEKEEV